MSGPNGTPPRADAAAHRDEWIAAVNELVTRVEGWCKELDWATRRAPKRIKDRILGTYELPMLLTQQWDAKLLLNPDEPDRAMGEGRVNLYTMPEYDDVAVLLRRNGDWTMRVQMGKDERDFVPFTRDAFKDVVETFARRHAEA
jgi:hypothetical protein